MPAGTICDCGRATTYPHRRCDPCRNRKRDEANARAKVYADKRWRICRMLTWSRDVWTCVRCGHVDVGNKNRTLDCHHKRKVLEILADGGNPFDPDECETLCDTCHGGVR